MRKVGLITIGQSPREDVLTDLLPIFGGSLALHQAGALDGLTAQEIAAFAPKEGEYTLISRMRDGSSVVFAERHILPRLQQCINTLEREGVELIMFLCTGEFPEFKSRVPLVFPCRVLNGAVPALTNRSSIVVITPLEEQKAQCSQKWAGIVDSVQVVSGSPYGAPEELERAAQQAAELDADLVVMDCIGYTCAMKERVREISGKPVVLSRTLAARVVMELLS